MDPADRRVDPRDHPSRGLSAFHCLTEGTSCGEHVPSAKYPDFRGVMTWSINWDRHDGFPLSKEVGGFLHGS